MKRCLDVRLLLCLLVPFMVAFAPLPHEDGTGKDIGNSAPPGIGGDGPWNSMNTILVGRLSLADLGAGASNVTGNDCWGWTDSLDGKEYAIVGLTNATAFVDIDDPANPLYLGQLPTQTGNAAWRDMKVYNDHVFIVSDGNGDHGMQVFDLTQLRTADPNNPSTFSNTAWYDDGTGSCHNIAINEATGFAYLVGSQHPDASGGLQVVNINNPVAPVPAGEFSADGYTHDCQVVIYAGPDSGYTGQEIAFCCNEDTVTIVNVNNKLNMTQISRNAYSQDGYTHQGWLSEDHRYFYMGDELDENQQGGPTRTHVFDCLDLDSPVYKGFYTGPTNSIDHNLYVKGNRLFCGNYSSGLRVLEMDDNDPSILTEVAYFDTYNTNNGTNFDGVWSVYPYFASETILVNDRQNGMFLVKLSPISIAFPNGRPEMINPAGGVEFQVSVSDFEGTAQPNSGVLHVDVGDGNGYQPYPMTESSPGIYDAEFPASQCGSTVVYYVSASATDGTEMCVPSTAPEGNYQALSAETFTISFSEDFETDTGWTVTGDAVDGPWDRGVPIGGGNRGDPPTDGDGSGSCYLTDNEDGNSDIDDGSTILTSPNFDATASPDQLPMISYLRWYSNDFGGSPSEDIFVIDISNDGGVTWTNLETVGPAGDGTSGGWIKRTLAISDFVTPTNQMRLRFNASDLINGSVVEAGIDGVQVMLIDCAIPVAPIANKMLDGVVLSGKLGHLTNSDDLVLDIDPSPTTNPFKQKVEMILQTESPIENPTSLAFRVEASMFGGPVGDVIQEIRLLNELTSEFELIDSRPASDSDEIVQVAVTGDVTRFLHPLTDEMTAKVTFATPAFSGSTFTWSVEIDQTVWVLGQ